MEKWSAIGCMVYTVEHRPKIVAETKSVRQAALIAIAPELLEALENLVVWLQYFKDEEGEISTDIAVAQAIVAKARGE
jgi:hypothetical protein